MFPLQFALPLEYISTPKQYFHYSVSIISLIFLLNILYSSSTLWLFFFDVFSKGIWVTYLPSRVFILSSLFFLRSIFQLFLIIPFWVSPFTLTWKVYSLQSLSFIEWLSVTRVLTFESIIIFSELFSPFILQRTSSFTAHYSIPLLSFSREFFSVFSFMRHILMFHLQIISLLDYLSVSKIDIHNICPFQKYFPFRVLPLQSIFPQFFPIHLYFTQL